MDIEKIEKLVAELTAQLDAQAEGATQYAMFEVVLPVVQLQLLLHIYRKLEFIEKQLTPQIPPPKPSPFLARSGGP